VKAKQESEGDTFAKASYARARALAAEAQAAAR
jgi:hypothetical protein